MSDLEDYEPAGAGWKMQDLESGGPNWSNMLWRSSYVIVKNKCWKISRCSKMAIRKNLVTNADKHRCLSHTAT